ncbi:NnrS family protein [Varunaivibrio sulfuroxidans]|uniref:Uncharacterized protein involved in response to NO n=1 Tax=Varunaivibrio sulfuroxidans TaxID=1773489 RepID=A0A4V2UNK9_9PROT|nr:NnrS family protein [Varunaivibrio sulfuroxidans]TCS62481.1 uncharacterized protein involved in response to NO [Varunaivibrio sulfuroxidans]WES30847.1 NnrS family protein [Varunaivibrio sulfuroxidans]
MATPITPTPHVSPSPPSHFALFASGFRPFFLAAGIQGVLAMVVWVLLYGGRASLPITASPAVWHGHEMLYGYAMAAISGFLLTVVPNWTGQGKASGGKLIGLFSVWVIGRIAYWMSGYLPAAVVAVADLAYIPVLLLIITPPLMAASNRRQMIFVPIMAMVFLGDLMVHLDSLGVTWLGSWLTAQRGLVLGLDMIMVLITIMGGRVIPSFTSSTLGHGDPTIKVVQRPWVEKIILPATALVALADLIFGFDHVISGTLALIVGVLHGVRMSGWQTRRTLANPILWVLHLGYAWLVVGFVLKGFAVLTPWIDPISAFHAQTVGAIGIITLGIMTRASLGHSGRVIRAAPSITLAYILIALAALVRVLGAAIAPDVSLPYLGSLEVGLSGTLWALGFLLYTIHYTPIFLKPRIDGRPG